MSSDGPSLVFTPGRWTVELKSGGHAYVYADGYSEEHGEYVFTVLVRDEPNRDHPVARLPSSIVADVFGPDQDDPSPCPSCGAGPEQSSDPSNMSRSVCYCGHPRYLDYRVR